MTAFNRVNFEVRLGCPAVIFMLHGGKREAIAFHREPSKLVHEGLAAIRRMAADGHPVFGDDPIAGELKRRRQILEGRLSAAVSQAIAEPAVNH